ncbi:hypothetical protein NL676_030585 [Syzygium grande]|nr:hypothetical protein NL676_030585 [Syzygium grande]
MRSEVVVRGDQGRSQFYCQLVPPPAKKAVEPATGYPAARTPPASNSAAAYRHHCLRQRRCGGDIHRWDIRPTNMVICRLQDLQLQRRYLPCTHHQWPGQRRTLRRPPLHAGGNFMQTARPPYAAPPYGHLQPANGHPPAGYGYAAPPLHAGGNFMQTARPPYAAPPYGHLQPANGHPPAGYGYAAPPPHAGGNFTQTAYPPYTAPTYGYPPPPANVHPPARHGHAGRKILEMVTSGVNIAAMASVLASSIDY